MKHLNKILFGIAAISAIGCSSEKYSYLSKVKVDKTPGVAKTANVATPEKIAPKNEMTTFDAAAAGKVQGEFKTFALIDSKGNMTEIKTSETSKTTAPSGELKINRKEVKQAVKMVKNQIAAHKQELKAHASAEKAGGDVPKGLLIVLCFFIPWLAVGLATDWDVEKIIYNVLWTFLCGIPGIIHALIIVSREA